MSTVLSIIELVLALVGAAVIVFVVALALHLWRVKRELRVPDQNGGGR